MGSEEKRPIHRRPSRMRFFSAVDWKVVLEEMAQVRSCSEEEEEWRIFAVASCHNRGLSEGLRKSWGSWERKPMSTRTRTNSGKPW